MESASIFYGLDDLRITSRAKQFARGEEWEEALLLVPRAKDTF